MRQVLKWPVSHAAMFIEIPWVPSARFVLVAAQQPSDYTPTVWVDYPDVPQPDWPMRKVHAHGTGQAVCVGDEHVGSAVCASGQLVWHLYVEPIG